MGRLAVVLGSSGLGPGGDSIATAAAEHGAAIVQRHGGSDAYVLPHEIDHAANMRVLVEQGCDRVLAIASVGSLDAGLPVGSLICPDDFIALHLGLTTLEDERAHRAPAFDSTWRSELIDAWQTSGGQLRDGGVYWQTIGPRFETPAEIRMMAPHADVVGMTVASECIVAGELGLSYAAICVVDNFANGIGSEPLEIIALEAARAGNALQLHDGLAAVLPQLGAVGR